MAKYDVFISYSSLDKTVMSIVGAVESNGLKCWIAPRDITPGIPYARAIMSALNLCDNFVVFISANSLNSEDVLNEIDNAHSLKKYIIPCFIENVQLTPEFNYYLKRKQWLNIMEDINPLIRLLCQSNQQKLESFNSLPKRFFPEGYNINTTKSGVKYIETKHGYGSVWPNKNDNVRTHYEGFLTDGTIFDSSRQRGETAVFNISQVILGMQELLELMTKGTRVTAYIPAELAWGNDGVNGHIPPKSDVIFDIELLDFGFS